MFFPYNAHTKAFSRVDFPKPFGAFIRTVQSWFNCKLKESIEQNPCIFNFVNVNMIQLCLKYQLKVVS